MSVRRLFLILTVLAAAALGCGQPPDPQQQPFAAGRQADDEDGLLLVIALDLSGSFQALMVEDGRAWDYTVSCLDRFFRDRLGTGDEVILAQLSATTRPLLFQGSPVDLREQYDSAESFRRMLLQKSDPSGSRIFDGCADVLDHVLLQPGVQSGKKKVVFLVLSDLEDTTPNAAPAKARLLKGLKALAAVKAACGLYFVDQTLVGEWRRNLKDAGFKYAVVEPDIKTPKLPTFED